VDAAVDAAKEAYKTWRLVPAPEARGDSISRRRTSSATQGRFFEGLKREMGKVLAEARARRPGKRLT